MERERQRGFRAFRSRRMLTRGERVVASVRRAYHSFLSFFPFALDQVCERMGIKGNNCPAVNVILTSPSNHSFR